MDVPYRAGRLRRHRAHQAIVARSTTTGVTRDAATAWCGGDLAGVRRPARQASRAAPGAAPASADDGRDRSRRQRLPGPVPAPRGARRRGAGPRATTGSAPPARGWCAAPPRTPPWRTSSPAARRRAALVYSSGYLANLGAVRALVRPGTLVVSDAHNHASLVDGCRCLRRGGRVRSCTRTRRRPHADAGAVRCAARRRADRPAVVVTESSSPSTATSPRSPSCTPSLPGAPRRRAAAGRRRPRPRRARPRRRRRGRGRRTGRRARRGRHRDAVEVARRRPVASSPARPALRPAPGRHRPHLHLRHRPAAGRGRRAPSPRSTLPSGRRDLRAELPARAAAGRRAAARRRAPVPAPAAGCSRSPRRRRRGPGLGGRCRDRGVAVGCFRPPSTPDGTSALRLTINAGIPHADFIRALNTILALAPPAPL